MDESHVDSQIEERKSKLLEKSQSNGEDEDEDEDVTIEVSPEAEKVPDRIFIANKMRTLFKNVQEEGVVNSMMKLISFPLSILRDYTVPIGEEDQWDRQRASIIPMTIVFAFFWLNGNMQEEGKDGTMNKFFLIGILFMVPGAIIGFFIKMCTKPTEAPPSLITVYAILCFIMSIMWISFTSNCIMALLQLMGFITKLPEALLALTIVAWGNCLGDMYADVAMTKKGFGEMAITGCIAGPIFNVLIGVGLSSVLGLLKKSDPFKAKV